MPIGKRVQRCKKRRGGLEAGKTAHTLQPREDAPKGMGITQKPHDGDGGRRRGGIEEFQQGSEKYSPSPPSQVLSNIG